MSQFLFIAPSDYSKVDLDSVCAATGMSVSELGRFIQSNNYDTENLDRLRNAGITPEGKELHEFKLINDSELWALFVDE